MDEVKLLRKFKNLRTLIHVDILMFGRNKLLVKYML